MTANISPPVIKKKNRNRFIISSCCASSPSENFLFFRSNLQPATSANLSSWKGRPFPHRAGPQGHDQPSSRRLCLRNHRCRQRQHSSFQPQILVSIGGSPCPQPGVHTVDSGCPARRRVAWDRASAPYATEVSVEELVPFAWDAASCWSRPFQLPGRADQISHCRAASSSRQRPQLSCMRALRACSSQSLSSLRARRIRAFTALAEICKTWPVSLVESCSTPLSRKTTR